MIYRTCVRLHPLENFHATANQKTNILNGIGSTIHYNSKAQQNMRPQTEPST